MLKTAQRLRGRLGPGRDVVFSNVRRLARSLGYDAAPPMPPSDLRFMNESDERFLSTGDELLSDLRSWAGLRENHRVLDVGCGYGRFAHALLRWPEFRGQYIGFDILNRHISWCARNLACASRPKVQFQHLDIRNGRYNPKGVIEGAEVVFPVASGSIDIILLSSVFTHMDASNILRYLSEGRRALRRGGKIMASFFLLDETWSKGQAEGRCAYPMLHERTEYCRYAKEEDPLFAIGYRPEWVQNRISELGLELRDPIRWGGWCGRPEPARWQDFVVATKPG